MRYSNTERLGVIESDRVFTEEIQWIFREQSVCDFGIDAIIEEVLNKDPTGRLIAAQIKTGQGNFFTSNKFLTYYVSNIHYNYWLGYVLPVILIVYLPDSKKLLWHIVSGDTLKKTKTQWKIDIPNNQFLNSKTKIQLTEILDSKFRAVYRPLPLQGDPLSTDIYSLVEDIAYITKATDSTYRFIGIMTEMKVAADNQTIKILSFNQQGLSEFDSQLVASMNRFAFELKIFAKRIKDEMQIFAESFGLGFSAYIQTITTYSNLTNDDSVIQETNESLTDILKSLKEAREAIKGMQNSIKRLPKKYSRLKEARNLLVESTDLVLTEYGVAEDFIKKALNKSNY